MLASFLSTRAKRKGHLWVSFSFGDIIIKPNVAPQAKGVAETGSHIRRRATGSLFTGGDGEYSRRRNSVGNK